MNPLKEEKKTLNPNPNPEFIFKAALSLSNSMLVQQGDNENDGPLVMEFGENDSLKS